MVKNRESIGTSAKILNVTVISTTLESVLTKIEQICQSSLKKQPYFIVTVGPEFVIMARHDRDFARIIAAADLPLAEGMGLKLGTNQPLSVVPGRKLVSELVNKNYRIFYLGGRDKVAQEMVEKYGGESDPGEVDIHHPVRNFEIVAKINHYAPDILLVAYGAPYQEKWLSANLHNLKAKVVMGVGGSFDYLTGRAKLPPDWINKMGLEWLWRLVLEPWRWRRQLRLVEFLYLVVKAKLS